MEPEIHSRGEMRKELSVQKVMRQNVRKMVQRRLVPGAPARDGGGAPLPSRGEIASDLGDLILPL